MAEHHGLKAKIASWKAQPDVSNEAAEDDLAVNRQQPEGYRHPLVSLTSLGKTLKHLLKDLRRA